MAITIKEARKYLREEKGIILEYATRFLEVKVKKSFIGAISASFEAVVGVKNNVLYIIYKRPLKGYERFECMLEIDHIRYTTGLSVLKNIFDVKTVTITLKKETIILANPFEGEYEKLMQYIDLNKEVKIKNQIKRTKQYYYMNKTLKYGKYAAYVASGYVVAPIAHEVFLEWIGDKVKDVVADAVVNHSDEIAQKVSEEMQPKIQDTIEKQSKVIATQAAKSVVDRLNPFS